MKNLFLITLISSCLIFSCSKNKPDTNIPVDPPIDIPNPPGEDEDPSEVTISKDDIIGQWNVDSENSPYLFFEFTENGRYFILKRTGNNENGRKIATTFHHKRMKKAPGIIGRIMEDGEDDESKFYYGKWEIKDDSVILNDFGKMSDIIIAKDEFTLSFTLQIGPDKETYVTNKTEAPISTSEKTALLCNNWILDSIRLDQSFLIDHPDWAESFEEDLSYLDELNEMVKGANFLFSRAGTYLVVFPEDMKGDDYDPETFRNSLMRWKWKDNSEEAIVVGYFDEDGFGDEEPMPIIKLDTEVLALQEDYEIFYCHLEK